MIRVFVNKEYLHNQLFSDYVIMTEPLLPSIIRLLLLKTNLLPGILNRFPFSTQTIKARLLTLGHK